MFERFKERVPGLILSGVIGVAAYALWQLTKGQLQISSLLWAFVLSLLIGNLAKIEGRFLSGIRFASTRLLRVAVGGLGLAVSAAAWWRLGGAGLAVVLVNLVITLGFGFALCRGLLRLSVKQALLIATGTAICGASAIAATSPAIEADEKDTALALAVITLFGLAAMFLYPVLYSLTPLGSWLGQDPLAFGLWSGVGIHETAQVIASASQVEGALEFATLAKSVRIFMIGPVVLLAVLVFRRSSSTSVNRVRTVPWPWFAVVFVGLTFAHAGLELWWGQGWTTFAKEWISPIIKFALTWAFAAVGLRVKLAQLRAVGAKAVVAGLLVAGTAGVTALILTKLLWL